MTLTADRLREVLDYDRETGVFTWLESRGRVRAGVTAGAVDSKGHLRIRIDGQLYGAHRLAWLYMKGHWPELEIDHRDTNKLNNRWSNLREATPTQNRCNRVAQANSSSGVKGVWWHKATGKWRSAIRVRGAVTHLGLFTSIDEAAAAYAGAANDLHGDFARVS